MITKHAYKLIAAFNFLNTAAVNVVDVEGNTIQARLRGSSSSEVSSLFTYINTIRKSGQELSLTGVFFSTNEETPTEDDYQLKNLLNISGVTATNVVCTENDDGSVELYTVITVPNSTESMITIKSIYYTGVVYSASGGSAPPVLVDHTKLANPITIPAGQTKSFTYTLKFNC